MQIKNKVAIVTGASSGVGEACARLFVENGAKVAVAARSARALEDLKQEFGEKVLVVPTDVADINACQRLVVETLQHFGQLDILVNNAGYHATGEFEHMPIEEIGHTLDVNLKAPMCLTRMAMPHLLNASQGRVVNVASLAGHVPVEGEATYSTSKFGLRAFSLALAEELRFTNLRVSLVSPGPIDTGFIMNDIDEVADLVFSQPMSTAEEIAQAILMCVEDGKPERVIPALSGMLATAAYLLPGLRRNLKPLMEYQGRRAKRKYKLRNEQIRQKAESIRASLVS